MAALWHRVVGGLGAPDAPVAAARGLSVGSVAGSGASVPGAFAGPRGLLCCGGVTAAACCAVPGDRDHALTACGEVPGGCDDELLVDSAAGETVVPPMVASQWGAPARETIEVVDANQRVIQAAGGAPLYGWVHDDSGARVWVLLARRAFTGSSFGANLLSLGAAHSTGCGSTELTVDRPALVMGDGTRAIL